MRPIPLALVTAVALATACGGELRRPPLRIRSAALVAATGCADVEAQLAARALAQAEARLERNLELALSHACYGGGVGADGSPVPLPAPTGGGAGPSEWSGTNDQVAGVDEPDLVKTDGTHLYVVADGKLQVLASWPAAETRRIGALALPGTPKRLLVDGDRAVVFSSLGDPAATPPPGSGAPLPPGGSGSGSGGDCTYGYDCVPQGDGTPLLVSFVDLSDPAAPRIVRETRFSASYLAARRVGDAVHVAVISPERRVEGIDTGESLVCSGLSEGELRAKFAALRAANRARVEATDFSTWLPSAVDATFEGGVRHERPVQSACDRFWVAPDADGTAFLSVASFAVAGEAPVGLTTTLGRPGVVYADGGTLYVAAPQAFAGDAWFWPGPSAGDGATTIHAFELCGGAAPASEYLGSGVIHGRVLNAFSLDAHDGDLRVATTTGSRGASLSSSVSVLRRDGATLEEIGRLDGIAPGEDLRAVRFDGDRAFVVTFEKTDPLFVVDLADPAAPRLRGELVVPGFSTYLHLVDPAHLLTIGFDADPDLGFSWFQGIRLQLFDVADAANPALVDAEVIGSRGTASEAASDHLAFTWFPPKALLGVPITVCEGGDGGSTYGTEVTFNGLLVYRVTTDGGFAALGGVSHPLPSTTDPWTVCSGWWTRSSSFVKRSVFVEDYVYSLTADEVRVQDTRALGTDLARVALTGG